jgi:hypothetical protein
MHTTFKYEYLNEETILGDVGVDRRVALEWISKKFDRRM